MASNQNDNIKALRAEVAKLRAELDLSDVAKLRAEIEWMKPEIKINRCFMHLRP